MNNINSYFQYIHKYHKVTILLWFICRISIIIYLLLLVIFFLRVKSYLKNHVKLFSIFVLYFLKIHFCKTSLNIFVKCTFVMLYPSIYWVKHIYICAVTENATLLYLFNSTKHIDNHKFKKERS